MARNRTINLDMFSSPWKGKDEKEESNSNPAPRAKAPFYALLSRGIVIAIKAKDLQFAENRVVL